MTKCIICNRQTDKSYTLCVKSNREDALEIIPIATPKSICVRCIMYKPTKEIVDKML